MHFSRRAFAKIDTITPADEVGHRWNSTDYLFLSEQSFTVYATVQFTCLRAFSRILTTFLGQSYRSVYDSRTSPTALRTRDQHVEPNPRSPIRRAAVIRRAGGIRLLAAQLGPATTTTFCDALTTHVDIS